MNLEKQSSPDDYFIAGNKLRVTECERDFGILVSSDGTWYEQVDSAASKANMVLGLMKTHLFHGSEKIARIIYPTFVRPHLEFASVRNPHLKYDSKTLESPSRKNLITDLTKTGSRSSV